MILNSKLKSTSLYTEDKTLEVFEITKEDALKMIQGLVEDIGEFGLSRAVFRVEGSNRFVTFLVRPVKQ